MGCLEKKYLEFLLDHTALLKPQAVKQNQGELTLLESQVQK